VPPMSTPRAPPPTVAPATETSRLTPQELAEIARMRAEHKKKGGRRQRTRKGNRKSRNTRRSRK
jgi:hypothetical protein